LASRLQLIINYYRGDSLEPPRFVIVILFAISMAGMSVLSEQAPLYDMLIGQAKERDAVFPQRVPDAPVELERVLIDRHDDVVVVVCRDAIDRKVAAVLAAMDDHQLTLIIARVLLAPAFERQPDRFHARLTGRQPIARRVQIEMARGQAVRTVIAIIHARQRDLCRDEVAAVHAHKIAEGVASTIRASVNTSSYELCCHG
jgi:hypothetical protein